MEYLSSIVFHTVLVAGEYSCMSKQAELEYLSSIVFHTVLVARECVRKTVGNTIDDRYSSFALLSNVATFLRFALLSNVATFLGIACFDIFSCHYDRVEYFR